MGLISARALKHRHTLWLSLLFNYVYMGQWRRPFSFLKSCKATYSISCLSSYSVCMCVPFSRELWIIELSHPYCERISRPHRHCDLQPSLSVGCLKVWVMQDRWSCSAGIQTCLHPWLPRPPIHLLGLFMCLWGVWCNNAGSASCCVIEKSLLCLSHTHSHHPRLS